MSAKEKLNEQAARMKADELLIGAIRYKHALAAMNVPTDAARKEYHEALAALSFLALRYADEADKKKRERP